MKKRTFVFGAGSSVHAGAPLAKNLVHAIIEKCTDVPHLKQAVEFLKTCNDQTDLEAIISLIDLSIDGQCNYFPTSFTIPSLKEIRRQLVNAIVTVLKSINLRIDPQIKSYFKRQIRAGDAIINFNYDLLVDSYLHSTGLWNPYASYRKKSSGYGFGTGYENLPIPKLAQVRCSKVQYIKPHGSINWLANNSHIRLAFNEDDPDISFDPDNVFQHTTIAQEGISFIIAPSYVKSFENSVLKALWRTARKAIANAGEIIIIGYSFPKADVLSRDLLQSARATLKSITIIDPLPDQQMHEHAWDVNSMLPWSLVDKVRIDTIPKKFEEHTKPNRKNCF